MDQIAPEGPVYQAGTLSGNPLATAAGLATLEVLSRPGIYEAMDEKAEDLEAGLKEAASQHGITCTLQRVRSMMTCFFGRSEPVTNFQEALASDTEMYGAFFRNMVENGIWLAPSQFEAAFVSLAHDWFDISETVDTAESVFNLLARK